MFPYRDNLTQGKLSWAVIGTIAALCALNIPLFLNSEWQSAAFEDFSFQPMWFSLHPFLSSYRLITASFLHADIFHLAGNCLFLAVFGRTLERLFGTTVFLASFPILGTAGFLTEWVVHPDSATVVIGASGSIAALMGAYLPLFPSAKVKMVAFFGIFFKRFTVPAWAFLPYWIVLQATSMAFGGDDGVAYAVHVGSFALGLIGAIVWKTSYVGADDALEVFTADHLAVDSR